MALANQFGNLMLDATGTSLKMIDPDGTLQVSPEATGLMLDSFDTALATLWTTSVVGGGTAPTAASSVLTFGSSATASQGSIIRTNNTYLLRASAYLKSAHHVLYEAGAIANNTRWWGIGTNQATPTAAAPVLNGAVFELSYTDGSLNAVIYVNGTRTLVPAIVGGGALVRQTDGAYHKYEVWYRQSRIDWNIDNVTVATRAQPPLAAFQSPYIIGGSINFTTAPATAPVLRWSGSSMSDTGANNRTNSDGVNPAIMQTVKSAQPNIIATDNPALVLALPAVGQVVTGYSAASATAVTATVPSPGSGLRNYITSVTFERFALAALTASATPLVSTVSNHGFVMTLPADAATQGSKVEYARIFPNAGIASTAQNTATTFTAPAVTNVSWRVTVTYYVAP